MSNFLIIVLVAVIAGVLYYKFKNKKHINTQSNELSPEQSDSLQETYNAKKHPKDEHVSLSLEEKIELSWQFLTNIAEKVMNKFSSKDQNIVLDAGQKMNKHGMTYQHNVNQEVKISASASKSKTQKKNKVQER